MHTANDGSPVMRVITKVDLTQTDGTSVTTVASHTNNQYQSVKTLQSPSSHNSGIKGSNAARFHNVLGQFARSSVARSSVARSSVARSSVAGHLSPHTPASSSKPNHGASNDGNNNHDGLPPPMSIENSLLFEDRKNVRKC